jgi:hypothetical protein
MHKKQKKVGGLQPDARPEGYAPWQQAFEGNEGVPALLEELAEKGVDVERVRTMLYAAPLLGTIKYRHDLDKLDQNLAAAQRHLQDAANLLEPFPFEPRRRAWLLGALGFVRTQVEERQRLLRQWRSAFTTVQRTDLVIAWLAKELRRGGHRKINEELATLLTAAGVPGGERDETANGWAWSADIVDKRRDRLKGNPLVAMFWRGLFEKIDIEKLAQRFPALFIKKKDKEEAKRKTFGQRIAEGTRLLQPVENPATQEAFGKGLSERLSGSPGRDKKPPEQS